MKCYTYDNLELNGRLGNQLWQIASTVGIARRDGGIARFNPEWTYRSVYPNVPEEYFSPIPEDYHVFDGGTDYLQDFSYFKFMQVEVREMFQPSIGTLQYLRDNYPDFYTREIRTAVHVRRGDYLKHPKLFPAPTKRYYMRARDQVLEQMPGTSFIVFSDDIPWCRSHLDYLCLEDQDVVFVEGEATPVEVADRKRLYSDYQDMMLMSRCQAHVISNSTFSWWGAFLAKGVIPPMHPSNWFGPGVPNWENSLNCIPEGWTKIEC